MGLGGGACAAGRGSPRATVKIRSRGTSSGLQAVHAVLVMVCSVQLLIFVCLAICFLLPLDSDTSVCNAFFTIITPWEEHVENFDAEGLHQSIRLLLAACRFLFLTPHNGWIYSHGVWRGHSGSIDLAASFAEQPRDEQGRGYHPKDVLPALVPVPELQVPQGWRIQVRFRSFMLPVDARLPWPSDGDGMGP